MQFTRVALVAVLGLLSLMAPAQAEERHFHLRGRPHGHHQAQPWYGHGGRKMLDSGSPWYGHGGRKMLDSGSPSRVIVNGEVIFESKGPPSPPSGFPEDNPARGGDALPPAPPCPLGTLPSFGSASGMAMFGGGPPPMTGLGSPPPSYGYGMPPPAFSDDAPRLGYFFNGKPCTPLPPPPSPPSPPPSAEPDFDNSGSDDDTSPPALFGLSPPSFDDHGGEESGSGKGKGGGKDD